MSENKAYKLLKKVQCYDAEIEQLKDEILEIETAIYDVSSQQLKTDVVKSSKRYDKHEEKTIKYISMKEELDKKIAEKFEFRQYALNKLHELKNDTYEKILYKRFFEKKAYKQIARELSFSESHIKNVQTIAMKELVKILKK